MDNTLKKHFRATSGQLLDIFDVDLQFVFPDYTGRRSVVHSDGTWTDASGATYRKVPNGFCEYSERVIYPLAYAETVDDLLSYDKWPDANAYDWDHYSEKIGDLNKKG